MAVQLILKNSAVQDKEATAAQLAAGELALNYHSSGPFLQCEDTAGNIWRLGGVVIASTAPSNPSKGAWWLDSDDNHLYFYNGSSWIEIQTGEIVPGDITEGTARQLLQTNAAGNGTEWTSNIDVPGTLDVTGVATFDNNVVITGNLTVNGTTTTIDTTTLVVEDKNIEMGAVDTPTDSTADGGGITLKGATDKTINWVNATDAWTSSERFDFPAGTQGAPSIILNGDVNSGLYQPGADQVAISTGGTGRLFVNASGNVGVGADAAKKLQVARGGGNATVSFGVGSEDSSGDTARNFVITKDAAGTDYAANIYFSNHATTNAGYLAVFSSQANERLRIDSSGRVGIGTSSPGELLTVNSGNVRIQGSSGQEFLTFFNSSTGGRQWTLANAGAGNAHGVTAGTLYFRDSTAGATRIVIDSSGNVGVGTTSPSFKTEIVDTLQADANLNYSLVIRGDDSGTNGESAQIFLGAINSTTRGAVIAAERMSTSNNHDMLFKVSAAGAAPTERLRIDSSGRVGVGTSSPGAKLDVNLGTSSLDGLVVQSGNDAGVTGDHILATTSRGNTSAYNLIKAENITGVKFLVSGSGNVGVGTTSPVRDLQLGDNTSTSEILSLQTTTSGDCSIYFGDNTATSAEYAGMLRYSHGSDAMQFRTSSLERLRIDSSGRVGIGTSSPSSLLHIGGNNGIRFGSGGTPEAEINYTAAGLEFLDLKCRGTNSTVGNIRFFTGNTASAAVEAMRIDNFGRVGIGTTSPTALLNLRDAAPALRLTADANDITELQFGDTGDTVRGNIVFHNGTGGNALAFHTNNNNEQVRIDSSGRLLVGTSSSSSDGLFVVEGTASSNTGSGKIGLARGSSPANGNPLGFLQFLDNTHSGTPAEIGAHRDGGTWSASSKPTRLVFSTTADGASTPTERVRVESGGKTKFSGGAYGIERTITPSLFNLHEGNFWTCGAIAIPNPQNQVAGFMGSIRVTAAPTSFGSHFDFPGGTYTAPTSFPAVAPFFVQASGTILVGSWTEGIA